MMNFLLFHTPLFYLTQSVWRDEAYSILLSEHSPLFFFRVIFDPPLYYILLHYWMKLFGESEIAARSLSLVGFAFATIIVIYWAEKLFKKHWLSWFLPVFFFLNPMLIYFAFEIRAYGWYTFFAVASMFTYFERRWKLYTVATLLGLYTHTYMIFIPIVQLIHYLIMEKKIRIFTRFSTFIRDPMVQSTAVIGLVFVPWLYAMLLHVSKLSLSWYFPVDLQLVKSVLGNIFLDYEGTPWFLWIFTAYVSLVLLLASIVSMLQKKFRMRNGFFFLMLYVPVIIVVGVSFIKPLYVNRYLIPSTIAEIFLVIFAIEAIKNKLIQKIVAAGLLLFVVGFNTWYPLQHKKVDIRTTIYQVNALLQKRDVVLVDTSLVLFETMYYSHDRSKVYFYNPQGEAFPWYVGDSIVSHSQIVTELPPYPIRAFIIHKDGSYDISYNTNITYHPKLPSKGKTP